MTPSDNRPDRPPRARALRSRVFLAIKLLVAGGMMAWLVRSGRLSFAALASTRRPEYLALAGVLLVAGMLLPIWRWAALMRIQGLPITWRAAVRIAWLSYFAGLFLPGAVGADLARAYSACSRHPEVKARAISTVLIDRILGLYSLMVISCVAGAFLLASGHTPRQAGTIGFVFLCMAAMTLGIFLISWRPSLRLLGALVPGSLVRALEDSRDLYFRARGEFLGIFAYSELCNAVTIASYLAVAAAVGNPTTWGEVLAVPLVIVANAIPISPSGLGVGEAVGWRLFDQFGISNGALIVLVIRLAMTCACLPGAFATLAPVRADAPGPDAPGAPPARYAAGGEERRPSRPPGAVGTPG